MTTPYQYKRDMEHLRLRPNEYTMWKMLMGVEPCCTEGHYFMKMNEWPESLQNYVTESTRKIGVCGDVLACLVADWVAGRAGGAQ